MRRPRVAIDTAVLAAAIRIQTCLEADIGTGIARNDRFCVVAKKLRFAARSLLLKIGLN